jgi:hypothetical protein
MTVLIICLSVFCMFCFFWICGLHINFTLALSDKNDKLVHSLIALYMWVFGTISSCILTLTIVEAFK